MFICKNILFVKKYFFIVFFYILCIFPLNVFAATTIFSDTFNGSGVVISSHTPDIGTSWTLLVNNGMTISVKNSIPNYAAVTSNAANAGSIYTADGTYPSADYEISADAVFAAGDSNYTRSLILRAQDANNMYLLRISNSTMTIYKRVSGTWTSLASGTGVGISDNLSSPYRIATLTFQVLGNTLTGKVNGVTKVIVDDSSITATGKAGIGLGYTAVSTDDGGTGVEIDDVLVQTVVSDVTAPTITNVSSDKSNGSYKAGEVIDIDVTFSEAVTSTGDVTVTLETGDTDQTCTFTVSNSTTGTCNYTVQAGDISSDLTVASISGIIKDSALNTMTDFTPVTNLAANKAIVIDTISPVISEVTAVITPTSDTTPDYTFTTDEAGTISYGGSCSSSTTSATVGSNTITFVELSDNSYADCTITVNDTANNNSNTLTITTFVIDSTSPLISSISSTKTTTSAIIIWTTNEDSSSQILYGLTDSYGSNTTEADTSTRVTSHSVEISGLSCGTTYHYKVISKDSTENISADNDNTLITNSCPVNKTVSTSASTRVQNLLRMGKNEEAQKIIKEFPNMVQIPIVQEKVLVQNKIILEGENVIQDQLTDNRQNKIQFSKTIKSGSLNNEVKMLQEFLNNNGFNLIDKGPGSKGEETDFFGELSRNALIKFQQSKGLIPDGIFGPRTRKIVNDIIYT